VRHPFTVVAYDRNTASLLWSGAGDVMPPMSPARTVRPRFCNAIATPHGTPLALLTGSPSGARFYVGCRAPLIGPPAGTRPTRWGLSARHRFTMHG